MSDTPTLADPDSLHTEVEEFLDRTSDEVAVLERQFKGGGYGGQPPYVAAPAKGHDTKGLWHYFPAHARQGYAAHAIALQKLLLDELRVPTALVPHRMAGLDIETFPADRADMLTKWMADGVGLPEATIVSLPPETGMYDSSRALVSYVAGPEATLASEFAVQMVNSDRLTALWCVSPFTARAYKAAGANPDKVFVVRPPICDGIWRDMFKPLADIKPRVDGPFVFGALGTWHERKGFHDLVRAYFSEFKREHPVELHIRTSSMDSKLTIKKFEELVISEIALIAKNEFGDDNYPASKKQPRIKLLTGTALTEQQLIDWIGSVDCFVNPSYAEGLGIPQMWALAQGVPLVTSNFGAVGEFMNDPTTPSGGAVFASVLVPVPVSMRAHSPIWGAQASWGGYDIADLAEAMLEMASKRLRFQETAQYTRTYFSNKECAPSLKTALAQLCRPEVFKSWGL